MNDIARSLNVLTALLAGHHLVRIDGQVAHPTPPHDASTDGPWICVDFEDGMQFAIWKETAAIYRVGPTGAVEDDPVISWQEDGTPVLGGLPL